MGSRVTLRGPWGFEVWGSSVLGLRFMFLSFEGVSGVSRTLLFFFYLFCVCFWGEALSHVPEF